LEDQHNEKQTSRLPIRGGAWSRDRRLNSFAFRNRFFRHHNHFRNFLFVGALGWPYYYGYGYSGCWQQVWTGDGWRWANACYDYGY
jgi:hypothetical protein